MLLGPKSVFYLHLCRMSAVLFLFLTRLLSHLCRCLSSCQLVWKKTEKGLRLTVSMLGWIPFSFEPILVPVSAPGILKKCIIKI